MAKPATATKGLVTCVVAHTAILHNGKRYDVGDEIRLTELEAQRLAVYVTVKKADENKAQDKPLNHATETVVTESGKG